MQKIIPYLWFDDQAEEAIGCYTSAFTPSSIQSIAHYPEEREEAHMRDKTGKVLNAVFELSGQRFMAIDGGDTFKFNLSISFFVNATTEQEVDTLWTTLSERGSTLMPLQAYPFSPKFGWVMDAYGVSWQISLGARPQKITPTLMFVGEQHGKAEEAMRFYTSLFEHASIQSLDRYGEGERGVVGTVRHAFFTLHNQEFSALDSNEAHAFAFNEAISFYVACETQDEVDHLWSALSAHPASEQCGWLKDKFGISWQIIPNIMEQLLSDPNPEKARRVMDAMLQMKKIDIATLQQAHSG